MDVYWFPVAAVKNHHTLGGFKQFFSQFWRGEVQTQGVDKAIFWLESLVGIPFLASSSI